MTGISGPGNGMLTDGVVDSCFAYMIVSSIECGAGTPGGTGFTFVVVSSVVTLSVNGRSQSLFQ